MGVIMHGMDRSLILRSVIIVIMSVSVVFALDSHGRHQRRVDEGYRPDDPRLRHVLVDRPEEAYRVWRRNGYHGRIIVALGTRLNFVRAQKVPSMLQPPFPLQVPDLLQTSEGGLRSNNYLLVAMKAGVAREIVSVVPDRVLRGKISYAQGAAGVSTSGERIAVPYFGSPRTITALAHLRVPHEPVLLYVNASFFRDSDPRDVIERLCDAGISTDLVVLCRSLDDREVTAAEREKLRRFETLLGGRGGKVRF